MISRSLFASMIENDPITAEIWDLRLDMIEGYRHIYENSESRRQHVQQ